MSNEEKKNQEDKVDQPAPSNKKEYPTNHSAKIVILVVALVLVACGLATVIKFAAFRHKGSNVRTGRFEMMRNQEPKMMGRGRMGGFSKSGFGISGTISDISGDKLTVKTSDKDQVVDITDTTSIIKSGQIVAKGDLKENDTVVVAGTSNSAGELVATQIRVQ